jgi:ribonuclease T2
VTATRLTICLIAILAFSTCAPLDAQKKADPGDFDFYVFTLSWSPQFCAQGHPDKTECSTQGGNFVVHGLWPQWGTGKWPQNCSNEAGPSNPADFADIMDDPSLLEHEWEKHGTCSGLGVEGYFNMIRNVRKSIVIPALFLHLTNETQMTPANIKDQFLSANPKLSPKAFAVGCANNTLVQVQVCIAKDGSVTSCAGVKDCRASSIPVLPVIQ